MPILIIIEDSACQTADGVGLCITVVCSHVAYCGKGKWPLAVAWEFSIIALPELAEVVKGAYSPDEVSAVDPGVG